MTEDDLVSRLSTTLRTEASRVVAAPDAWERFSAVPAPVHPIGRRAWIAAPVVLVAAVLVVVVVTVAGHPAKTVHVAITPPATSAVTAPVSTGPATTAPEPPTTLAAAVVAPVGGPVPPGFAPSSVTFVSPSLGWVLGTAPCPNAPCTSIVRTSDGGATWRGIPAPRTAGVRSLRFADSRDGWAFGPELWTTHDGGTTWHQQAVGNVEDVAASDGVVHVAFIDGTQVRIESTGVANDAWALSPVSVEVGAGPVPTGQIVLHGASGWFVQLDRVVIGGARLASGNWTSWTPPCATAGGTAVLDASSPVELVAACDEGVWSGGPRQEALMVSHDGGTRFTPTPTPVPLTDGSLVATPGAGRATVAGTASPAGAVLEATADGGATWRSAYSRAQGSWLDLGFTTAAQGVAIIGGSDGSELLMTHDAGVTWTPVSF